MTKQHVYIAIGACDAKDGSQAKRVFDAVKATGQRGATKVDVLKAVPDVMEKNVSYHLNDLKKRGALGLLGDPRAAAKPVDVVTVELAFMVAFENLVVAKAKAKELPLDADEAYQKYLKVKPAYMGRRQSTDQGTKNEAENAFRLLYAAIGKTII